MENLIYGLLGTFIYIYYEIPSTCTFLSHYSFEVMYLWTSTEQSNHGKLQVLNKPLARKTQAKDTTVIKMAHIQSSRTASQRLEDRKRNQDSVCRFWWLSNSSQNFSWTRSARIVCRPWREALRWENTGLLAKYREKNIIDESRELLDVHLRVKIKETRVVW